MVYKIDIDGVLRNMEQVMVDIYNEEFGTHMTVTDIGDYDLYQSFPLFKERGIDPYRYFFKQHEIKTLFYAPVYPGVVEVMRRLHKENRIVIATHQPTSSAKTLTLQWLGANHIPYDAICFTNDKDKRDVVADVVVDDYCQHLNDESGCFRICINHPHNQCGDYELRLDNFGDYTEELEAEVFKRLTTSKR